VVGDAVGEAVAARVKREYAARAAARAVCGRITHLVIRHDDPEPPSPAAPALAVVVPLFRCATCRDTGRVAKPPAWFAGRTVEGFCPDCTPHYDFASRRFANCATDRAGEETPPPNPAPVSFDRTEHLRRIGQSGGLTTLDRYGRNHFRAIGKAGYAACVKAHGGQYARDLLRAKGWTPRTPGLLADLRAGRELASWAA
jgi:hypothetical protein